MMLLVRRGALENSRQPGNRVEDFPPDQIQQRRAALLLVSGGHPRSCWAGLPFRGYRSPPGYPRAADPLLLAGHGAGLVTG